MNTALALSALLVLTGPRPDLPPEQVLPRFESQCADGRWNDAQCPGLRTELELQLLTELQVLQGRAEIDRATLQAAARARFPMLAEFGLRRLGKIGSPEDREAVLVALEHPAPGVRALARQMLEVQDDRFRNSIGPWFRAADRNGIAALVPDGMPEPAQLGLVGMKDLGALRYRYFASSPNERRAVFTTTLTPDQVLAQVVPKGTKVFDGSKLPAAPDKATQQSTAQSMEAAQKEIQAAMARGDMAAVIALSQKLNAQVQKVLPDPDAVMLKPVPEFSAPPQAVRHAQLPASRKGQMPVTIAVGRDEKLGATVLVVRY